MNTPVGNAMPKFEVTPRRRTVEIELPIEAVPQDDRMAVGMPHPASPALSDQTPAGQRDAGAAYRTQPLTPPAAATPQQPPVAAQKATAIPIHRAPAPTQDTAEPLLAETEPMLSQAPPEPVLETPPPAAPDETSAGAGKGFSEDETIRLLMDLASLQEDLERAREQTNLARRHVELVKEQLAKTTNEKMVMQEQLQQLMAEFDNYRKRAEREKAEATERGKQAVILKTLEVLDNLERALHTGRTEGGALADFLTGVELIQRQLADNLASFGVQPIAAVGEVFDPTIHEAIATDETNEYKPNTVLAELKRGYRLGDRLLRPAMVRVAVRPMSA